MTENNNNENFTKDEFFQKLKEFEEKWMKMLDIKESQIQKKISDLKENSDDILKKSKTIVDNYSSYRINESKLNDFASFQNKVNDMLITHEIRINNNIKDISAFSAKYDKIISENIFLPGFVGPSCQYKTLSEYINYNIDEVSRLKSEKEILKRDQKEYKTKIEGFIKQMVLLNETSMAQNREYTNSKQKDYELLIDGKLQPLSDKIFRFYELSSQFQSNVEKDIKLFRKDLEKILKNKEELLNIIKQKEDNLKKNFDELYKKVVLNIQDIGINKNKISGMKNEIDEINKSYDKLNTNINEINKEIKIIKNINTQKNRVKVKDIRHSTTVFNSFKNKLDLNNISPRRANIHKSIIFNKEKNIAEEDEEEKENNQYNKSNKDNDEIKNKKIDDGIQKDDDIDNIELNNNEKSDKTKAINQKKENNTQMAKSKYKSIYNDMFKKKDKETGDIFETFYLGNTKIPIISKPFFLEQKILSDEELRLLYKERKQKKKEKEKLDKIRKNFLNFDLSSKNKNTNDNINIINKGNNFNISYYKLSIPKLNFKQKSEDKMHYITHLDKKRLQDLNTNEIRNKNKNAMSIERTNYIISPKIKKNKTKNFNLMNLRLEDSAAINPEKNNGAYVLAKRQFELNDKTRLNLTPTSYVYLYDNKKGNKTSKLVSMTFMKEEQKISNSLSNTLEI